MLGDDVHAGDVFRHRMLHLQAGVHFHEIHRAGVQIVNELDRSGAHILHGVDQLLRVFVHRVLQFRGQRGGIGLFDHFLLVALHAAIAQAEHFGVPAPVAQHLHFDVPQRRDESLQIDVAAAESGRRLGGDAMKRLVEVARRLHRGDAFAATPMHGLDEHRIADRRRGGGGAVAIGQHAVTARHHRHAVRERSGDRVRLVAHRLHAGNRRPHEVDAARAHQFGKARVLRKKTNARMQGVRSFRFGDAHDGTGVQVALVRRVAANAHERIRLAKHVGRGGVHVRVRLHQHHAHTPPARHPHQLGRSATAGVDEHRFHRPVQRRLGDRSTWRLHKRLLVAERSGHHAPENLADRVPRHRNGRINAAQGRVQLRQKRVAHQRRHGPRHFREVVRQMRIRRQVAGHDDLTGERNARPRKVARVNQWMGDETRLRSAGAVAEAEHDHGQIEVAHETRNAVVHRGHRKQRAGALHGLHATRRNEAHHRQAPLGAQHQEFAELLRAGHVERSGFEGGVGDHGAHGHAVRAVLETTDAGHHATGRSALLQCALDGDAQAWEPVRIGADEIASLLLEVLKELLHEHTRRERFGAFLFSENIAQPQVPIGLHQAVPEVLSPADASRRDAPVVAALIPLGLQMRREQPLEQERDDDEQRVRHVRGGVLLPLLHVAEEPRRARRLGDALMPIEKLRAEPPDTVFPVANALCGFGQSPFNEIPQRLLRQRARGLGFLSDGIQVADDVVVDLVEQQQVFALLHEIRTQVLAQHDVDDGHFR